MRLTLVFGRSFTSDVPRDGQWIAAPMAATTNLHATKFGTLHVYGDFSREVGNFYFLVFDGRLRLHLLNWIGLLIYPRR